MNKNIAAIKGTVPTKLVLLLALTAVCGWLIYRNFFDAGRSQPGGNPPVAQSSKTPQSGKANSTASDLDPTLRLDLLEASREVRYEGTRRNIFQTYTPPPPPVVAPPTTPVVVQPPPVLAPPPIPLKFYGVAQSHGNPAKKAFLTNGEEIFIGQEGEVVGRFYRIARIGASSIEMEDTRTQRRQQLPLEE